jgi:hypothetical protein
VLAHSLSGEADAFAVRDVATQLMVTGCDLFSAGDFAEAERREDIVLRDPACGIYKRLVIEDDRRVGAVMYGDTADGAWFHGLIKDGTEIDEMRETLIFGPNFQGEGAADPLSAVAALPPEAEICGCNDDASAGSRPPSRAVRPTSAPSRYRPRRAPRAGVARGWSNNCCRSRWVTPSRQPRRNSFAAAPT